MLFNSIKLAKETNSILSTSCKEFKRIFDKIFWAYFSNFDQCYHQVAVTQKKTSAEFMAPLPFLHPSGQAHFSIPLYPVLKS